MKKLIATITTLVIGMSIAVTAFASNENTMHSGDLNAAKMSKTEIVQLLQDNPLELPTDIFTVAPDWRNDIPGTVIDAALQAATNRLNIMRALAGVPAVTLDHSLSENAQYGADLCAELGYTTHYPSGPADMSDSFYEQACEATKTSNLYGGQTLTTAVDGFMNDPGLSNLEKMGHRRWQLSPLMGKVGFGYAENHDGKGYVTEKVLDKSGEGCDYDFISWPASGNFPGDLTAFGKNTPWHISLNSDKYQIPDQSLITVTLTRHSDGKVWKFSGMNWTACESGAYFNVDTNNRGINNAIIFRPDGITEYAGVYTVTVTGLKTASGADVNNFTYQVDFFDTKSYYDKI